MSLQSGLDKYYAEYKPKPIYLSEKINIRKHIIHIFIILLLVFLIYVSYDS